MRSAAVVLLVIGACVITFGAVWLTIVFPGMEKLPADFSREDTFSGTYRVLNPATSQLDEIPVTIQQLRETVENNGDEATIKETVTTLLPTGQPVPQFPTTETMVVVDRVTRAYLPGGDVQRSGSLSLPLDVKPDAEYPIWVGNTGRALPAKYTGIGEVEGLEVYLFTISGTDLALTPDPQSGLPRVSDAHIELKVEPRSGATVDTVSQTSVSLMHPQAGKMPMFVSTISFTDDNVARSVSDARAARTQLIMVGSYMPWLVMGLGMLLTLAGISLYGLFCWRRMRAAEA
jgi:hypothetical protein